MTVQDYETNQPGITCLDIAGSISERIGSYVDMTFMQFVEINGDVVRCWYMNSGGKGPSYEITMTRGDHGWSLDLIEHPAGTEQEYVVP